MDRNWKMALAAVACAGLIGLAGCEDRDTRTGTDTYGTDRPTTDMDRDRDANRTETDTDINVKQVPEPDGVGTDTDVDVQQVPEDDQP